MSKLAQQAVNGRLIGLLRALAYKFVCVGQQFDF